MSSASAKFLSCKIVLLSPTCFVWPAHTSSGSFTIQLGVPTYIYLKTNWSLHWTQNTYGFAYRNRKPRGCTPRKQAERYFTRCDICNVLGPTVACVAWRFCRARRRSGEAARKIKTSCSPPQSPRGFSAPPTLVYYFATKTAMLRRLGPQF